jgi:hypothetical protein
LSCTRVALLGLAALLPAVVTCGGDSTGPQVPTALNLVSGDGQAGVVGQAVANPLVVKVADANGSGVPGVTVTWAITSGGGSLGATTGTSDATGLWRRGLSARQPEHKRSPQVWPDCRPFQQ